MDGANDAAAPAEGETRYDRLAAEWAAHHFTKQANRRIASGLRDVILGRATRRPFEAP